MKLSDKWNLLESKKSSYSLSTVRFDSSSPLEVFLAVDDNANHAILVHLPPSYTPTFDTLNNDNLELIFAKEGHYLLIRLLDSDFTSLFDDLIISLINSIKNTSNAVDASKDFISSYIKWNTFFTKTSERKLSKERVIGLWGELSYLLTLIRNTEASDPVDNLLKTWVGPFGAPHDFEFPNSSVEVKTKPASSSTIKISSEFQLDNTDEKPLNLAVLSVIESEHGLSIKDLFLKIKDCISKKSGDITLLLTALEKESLSEDRLSQYSNLLFTRRVLETFNCDAKSFPKIQASYLPSAISTVKYNLDIRELYEYKVSQENY